MMQLWTLKVLVVRERLKPWAINSQKEFARWRSGSLFTGRNFLAVSNAPHRPTRSHPSSAPGTHWHFSGWSAKPSPTPDGPANVWRISASFRASARRTKTRAQPDSPQHTRSTSRSSGLGSKQQWIMNRQSWILWTQITMLPSSCPTFKTTQSKIMLHIFTRKLQLGLRRITKQRVQIYENVILFWLPGLEQDRINVMWHEDRGRCWDAVLIIQMHSKIYDKTGSWSDGGTVSISSSIQEKYSML